MDLIRHQAFLREEDGRFICSRCGLENPTEERPCIPVSGEPSQAAEGSVNFQNE